MTGGYGSGPDIISSCSVNVERGEIVSILGPNGAGKSTAMKAMLGLLNLKSGSVIINGKDISKLSPQDRVKQGISFVPQTKNVFAGMTVEENLEMGAFLINTEFKETIDEIFDLFPILKEKKDQLVGELSGGQRQQVALGGALMIKPSVLMLDEPTAGVSPIVMDELFDHIIKVKRTNVAILMVEQNAKQALNISDRGYVLVTGENRYSGTGKELLEDSRVRSSFLGGSYGFCKRNYTFIKLHFCSCFDLWISISTWCYFCNFNLWNFTICKLCYWRHDVFWNNVYNLIYLVLSVYWYQSWSFANGFISYSFCNYFYDWLYASDR